LGYNSAAAFLPWKNRVFENFSPVRSPRTLASSLCLRDRSSGFSARATKKSHRSVNPRETPMIRDGSNGMMFDSFRSRENSRGY